jgi:hypothetical protein
MMSRICLGLLCALGIAPLSLYGQLNRQRGNAPGNVPQATYFVHRLGFDHAEGITAVDMNGDGKSDLLSGAFWYENLGANGGQWARHQYRTVELVGRGKPNTDTLLKISVRKRR